MILSGVDLRKAVKAEEIGFDPPIEDAQWGEASIDLRLGYSFTKLMPVPGFKISVAQGVGGIGAADLWSTITKRPKDEHGQPETYTLEPQAFILAMTYESIRVPRNLIARVEGRSTYARVGLSMHQTAPWIQPGWSGKIVLEIANHGPLRLELTPLVDRPCQITFFELKTPLPKEAGYGTRNGDAY